MRSRRRPDRDVELLRAARRRFAALVVAAFTLALALVAVVAYALVVREQGRDAGNQLAAAVARADDVSDPPEGIFLFLRAPGRAVEATPRAPAGLPDAAAMEATARDGRTRTATRRFAGIQVRLRTVRRGANVWQGAYDLGLQHRERNRLLAALLLAGGIGLVAVVGAAAVLGRRAVAPLGAALARQREFVADAAHELRAPLTVLHTRLQVLQRDADRAGHPALAEEATEVVGDSRRLAEVIDDLLLSAELTQADLPRADVNLVPVARAVVNAASAHAAAAGVTIRLTVPTGGAPAPVRGAEAALGRAVAALVDNAVGHTGPGGTVTVTVTAGDPVTVTVADTGVGLDPADSDRLFARFSRGQQVGDRRRFGLGLALVQEIVTNHGGRITVDGAPGVGATFTLLLPASPPR